MRTENEVWKLVDTWINSNVKENEAIVSRVGNSLKDVLIGYNCISNNTLKQNLFTVEMKLLRFLSEETVNTILSEIVESFRKEDL